MSLEVKKREACVTREVRAQTGKSMGHITLSDLMGFGKCDLSCDHGAYILMLWVSAEMSCGQTSDLQILPSTAPPLLSSA